MCIRDSLYSNQDVPFKAAAALQKGIEDGIVEGSEKHWTMVADAWYAADAAENALAAYEHAGKASTKGDIDLRRAYILVDMERWDEAVEALEAAIEKGGLKERKFGEAYLLLGMSEFSLGNFSEASTAWGRASKYPKQKKAAQQWMNHMREERARKLAQNRFTGLPGCPLEHSKRPGRYRAFFYCRIPDDQFDV